MDSLSSLSASGSESVSQIARFVRMEKCRCAEFVCDYDFHAAIETLHVELKNDNAVAVSYTWGNFNRGDRLIGHKKDDPTAAVHMNLAEEWVFPDFIDRLIEISDLRGAVWIDQLCNPEKDEDVSALLATIPDIYSTLDVQVLMPGKLCRCFARKALRLLCGGPGEFGKLFIPEDGGSFCINELGMSSHSDRLWPRQEFLYARNVQLKWNLKRFAECVPLRLLRINDEVDESVIEKLNPYTKLLYKQLVESNTDVLTKRLLDYFQGLSSIFHEIGLFSKAIGFYDAEKVYRLLTQFLLGHPVEKPPLPWQVKRASEFEAGSLREMADSTAELGKLCWFMNTTAELGRYTRSATKSKDYILSVFVDMPRYIIPAKRIIMKPGELLEDAIVQMESKWNVTMPTRAPAGLFNKLPSVSWRPSLHLSKDHFQSTADLYSSLPDYPQPLHFIAGRVPLKKIVANPQSITKRSSLYSDSFLQNDMDTVASICEKVHSNWPDDLPIRLRQLERDMFDSILRSAVDRFYRGKETEFKSKEGLQFSKDLFVQCLLIHHLCYNDGELVWTNIPCIDHHDTLYRATSFLLGLDYKTCQEHSLKLIIASDEPVCLGLIDKSFQLHGQPAASTDKVSLKDNYLTVSATWMEDSHVNAGDCLLETCEDSLRDSSTERPSYRVIGSWLPLDEADMNDIGARVFHRVTNEFWEEDSKRCDGWLI